MIEGINLLISIFIGCIVFIYYTNALFKPRTKYLYANISIIVGYMMLYAISSFYQPTLNVIAFSIATFVLMYLCFKVTLKNAIIQAFMLTAIMMLAEGVLFMFTGIGIYPKGLLDVSLSARIIHAVLSKLIYFLGIIIAKHVAKGKSKYEEIDGFLSLLAIPFFTIMVIVSIISVFPQINERIRVIFALIIVFGIIANIIVYWVHERTLQYQKEIQDFQEQQYKNTLELAYCHMLEEKLSQTRIMRHDFREHLKVLETYIQTDIRSAIDYLKSIKIRNEEIGVINYTTNKVLNILLSEKQKICTEKEITLKIHTTDVNFDFMKDIDIISIFSNLLNNAIEGSETSEKKLIYVNIYKMNNNFVIIKIENSCDKQPIEENGFYKTTKISQGEHGIGLKSVVNALKQYNGDLRMEYDSGEKIFSSMIMMSVN